MKDIKIIACDLDGTLLRKDKTLSEENLKALKACSENGIRIVPATGRYLNGMPESIRNIPFIDHAVTINGAAVWDTKNNELLYKAPIPAQTAVMLLEYFSSIGVAYNFYALNAGYMNKSFIEEIDTYVPSINFIKTIRMLYTPVDDLISFLKNNYSEVFKVQIFTKEPEKLRTTEAYVNGLGLPLTVSSSYVYNLEINNIEATKSHALRIVAEHLGYDITQTAAFGDGGNDLNMIKTAGTGIAMGNAISAVKSAADYVTLTNDENGVAEWIKNNIFK